MDETANDTLENYDLSDDEIIEVVEAVLFASGYPFDISKLSDLLSVTKSRLTSILSVMKDYYQNNNRGIQLVFLGDTVQLCTKEKYDNYVRQALGIKNRGKLSGSSLETLAIIAYNQPVTKVVIDQIRGNDSGYSISVLLEKGMIDVAGKLDVPGRPNLYKTTNDFLRVFGISDLSELPDISFDENQQLSIEGL
jgi:segregation and condensation protein B